MPATRLVGNQAALYIFNPTAGWEQVLNLYNWEFEWSAEVHEVRVKGDTFKRKMLGVGDGTLTAKAYVVTVAALSASVLYSIVSSPYTATTRLNCALAAVDNGGPDGFSTSPFQTWQFAGYIEKGSLAAPRGMAQDGFVFRLDQVPVAL